MPAYFITAYRRAVKSSGPKAAAALESTAVQAVCVAIILTLIALGAAGCGAEKSCHTSMNADGQLKLCKSDGPDNLVVGIDETAIRGDMALAADYAQPANIAAQNTINDGGHLELNLISRTGAQPEVLFDQAVPTLAQKSQDQRGADETAINDQWVSALKNAVTSTPPAGEFGSGIVDGLLAMLQAPTSAVGPFVVLAETDGDQEEEGFELRRAVQFNLKSATKRLLAMVPSSFHRQDALVVMFGIGATGGETTTEDPTTTNRMVQAWTVLCHRIATSCFVTAQVH